MAAILDIKSASAAKREKLRKAAYKAFIAGETAHSFARMHRVYSATVYHWYKRFKKDGETVIQEKKRGPVLFTGCVLNQKQMKRLQKTVIDLTPDQLKFDFALWSSKAVQEYIEDTWEVKLCRRTVRRYMQKLGFSSQCPISYAREQNPLQVERWQREEYPAIQKEAHETGAKIMWADEACALAGAIKTKGYSPKGCSPVVRRPANKSIKCKMISAVGNSGDLFFMFHQETMNTDIFKDFIQRLQVDIKQPIFLIVDNLRVHHAKILQSWLDAEWSTHKFKLFYLPSYSPELNPDEYLNRDVKAHLSETKIPKNQEELISLVSTHLKKKKADRNAVKRLFHKSEVKYAAKDN